ncbi:MAG: LysR substrate-binding domain-containing protein [Litorivicinus sp.]
MGEFISRGRVQGISLKAVRAFVESARLGSFKASAEWLNVTPSAVSHQVKALEDYLGVLLFHRGIREVRLTPQGARFAERAMEGLRVIDQATTEVLVASKRQSVRVAVAPFLATRWLMARMSEFEIQRPDIELEVIATTQTGNVDDPDIDLIIRLGSEPRDTPHYERLFQESLSPVGAAKYKQRVLSPSDLAAQPLLDVATRPGEWEYYLEQTLGFQGKVPHKMAFQNNSPAVEAAVAGMGLTLADPLLIRDELETQRLISLGDTIRGNSAYWLIFANHALANPRVQSFVEWLRESVGRDMVDDRWD